MSAVRPRPEQVAALTRGQPLPLPPLPKTTLHTVAEALLRAWCDLMVAHAEALRRGDEPEITSLLAIRLNALLDEDACWETLVCGVSREGSQISYDGSHIEKSPDLSIHLTGRRFDFPLVAECKLIDRPSRKTVNLYCREGIERFVRGEYAWMCAEAFMLAYVRDGSTIANCLQSFLANGQTEKPDPYAAEGLPKRLRSLPADLLCTSHDRRFAYLQSSRNTDPGPIKLFHLWLQTRP